ncbi:hypothetical protein [Agarivorans albus]|uniref:Carboxypeptidase regulatory-like domain-containing protein n=1 Tax=Agarivorans albus MKT 106 TaxID=1331007 RepID=R9PIR1_AGAAL|nr:hypothetical protein [Agarivorans albus]GAD01240.1 hypothetical protein AALB_1320 [Agarivorans albus MKT 106]
MTFNKWLKLSLLIICTTTCAGSFTTVKVKVVDQDGLAIEGAEVFAGGRLGIDGENIKDLTDKEGVFQTIGRKNLAVFFRVNKEGYYQTKLRTNKNLQSLTIELRKKKKTTAMYAKKLTLPVPKKREAIGFDFEQSDWIAPYGKGNSAHVFFYLDGEYTEVFNYNNELQVSFINANDGLVKLNKVWTNSEYPFPYLAPQAGYTNNLVLKKNRAPNSKTINTYEKLALGYIFRVNTKLNSEGEVIHANYGKISGEFFSSTKQNKSKGRENGFVKFTYYYNPTPNDRSLEFDWRQNLFRDLKHEEKVYEP